MFDGSLDFSSLALVAFLVASAAGALGMTRASIMAFVFTFVASTAGFVLDQQGAGANMAGFQNEIDPDSITFTSSAEVTLASCEDTVSCAAAGH